MKRRPKFLIDTLIYFSIYGLLVLLVFITLLGTSLFLMFVPHVSELAGKPAVTARTRRLVVLPTGPLATARPAYNLSLPVSEPAGSLQEQTVTFVIAPALVAVSHPGPNPIRVIDNSASPPVDLLASAVLPEMGSNGSAPFPQLRLLWPAKVPAFLTQPKPGDRHQLLSRQAP